MSETFTASDASCLPLSWYVRILGTGLSLNRLRDIKHAALTDFEEYRDQYKTWDDWAVLVRLIAKDNKELSP
jgi:hypothetical protein